MTEAEWLACQDPTPMLEFLLNSGRASHRKLRLFAVGCCLCVWPLITDEQCQQSAEVAGRYADGLATNEERSEAFGRGHAVASEMLRNPDTGWIDLNVLGGNWRPHFAARAAYSACCYDPMRAALRTADYAADAVNGTTVFAEPGRCRERGHQTLLTRDIFGSPFRSVAPDPSWMPPNAVILARTMYDGRDFSAMPLLADLLEEAGCPAEVGKHCRYGGPHVRGCWVVDLVLGQE